MACSSLISAILASSIPLDFKGGRFFPKLLRYSIVRHSPSLVVVANGQLDPTKVTLPSDNNKEDLAARLAAAEAEAEALRKELAIRKGSKDIDLSKLKPAAPEKRIDGTGYRETLLSVPSSEQPNKWGLSEAELFISRGAPTEGASSKLVTAEDDAKDIVTRRLVIGIGITVFAVCLSFLKLPEGFMKPAKPLFFYLVPILRFRDQLKLIEASSSDANSVRLQLIKAASSTDVSKDTFLSAARFLDEKNAERAFSRTYSIFDYLNQADYNKYFENLGTPTPSQEVSFLKFSLQAIQAALTQIDEFLSFMPKEALEAAQSNVQSNEIEQTK